MESLFNYNAMNFIVIITLKPPDPRNRGVQINASTCGRQIIRLIRPASLLARALTESLFPHSI